MKLKRLIWTIVAAAAIVATGCAIEPPLHLRMALRVIVKVLWKAEVYPDGVKPSGVSMYVFRDGSYYQQHTTADVDSSAVHLEPGRYRLYMISQSPEEFAWMEFSNLDDFDAASVQVKETKSSWYTREPEEVLIGNPEMMTVGVSDYFEVTKEMLEEYQKATDGVDEQTLEGLVRYYTIRVPLTPKSIVSQYWITIYSDNADLLKAVRASTTGMARSFYLTQDTTGPDFGTQIISDWKLTIDDPISRVGHLDGYVTTFGFPNGELPSADRDASLNIATLLVDNKTVEDYIFKVGNLITAEDPPDGYRMVYRLILGTETAPVIHPPNVRPPEESSGFDATVDDWGEGEAVEVDM